MEQRTCIQLFISVKIHGFHQKGTKIDFNWADFVNFVGKFLLGDDRVAEILLQNGADANLKNNDGDTVLHVSAFIGIEIKHGFSTFHGT